jgi:hypothetical protein
VGHVELKNLSADLFFGVPTRIFGIWGLVICHWKGLENIFPTVYSIVSSKMMCNSPKSPSSTGYFSNSTGSSVTNHWFFPDIYRGHIHLTTGYVSEMA